MRVDDLDYVLPEERIAQEPLAERDASKLMVVDVGDDSVSHTVFRDLASLLAPSLFVFNDTRVFHARLHGHKETGGKVELLLLREIETATGRWLAMGRSSKPLRAGSRLSLGGESLIAYVREVRDDGQIVVDLESLAGSVEAAIAASGEVPLPPYIHRAPTAEDETRYQTIFARQPGAVAAPTAGLHFTDRTMDSLDAADHRRAFVTLHVGPGTFRPVQATHLDGHRMHEEAYDVPAAASAAVAEARNDDRPIVAVGTTVVRTLESAADGQGGVRTEVGETQLFIQPPYRFSVVDHLITNFHLPRSTLLALVMSLAGVDLTRRAYQEAIDGGYRFYSYGDAMLIRGSRR
ncbi:MAG: tRNA preQ1(34) S-adenosylmethionine ribosyltransferase-isomerase QueA [Polyangiales bacterium]